MCINKRVRIFCWIFTTAANLETRARFVASTWAQHCDDHVFFVAKSQPDALNNSLAKQLKIVQLDAVHESRRSLYSKTIAALQWMASKQLFAQFDWFFKADDDTFLVVHNFKHLVTSRNPDEAYYVGRLLGKKQAAQKGFMSGGAGFALSRAAIRMFVNRYASECPDVIMPCDCDDMIIGHCLANWKVPVLDSIDQFGKQRFFPIQPEQQFAETPDESSQWLLTEAKPVEYAHLLTFRH